MYTIAILERKKEELSTLEFWLPKLEHLECNVTAFVTNTRSEQTKNFKQHKKQATSITFLGLQEGFRKTRYDRNI